MDTRKLQIQFPPFFCGKRGDLKEQNTEMKFDEQANAIQGFHID